MSTENTPVAAPVVGSMGVGPATKKRKLARVQAKPEDVFEDKPHIGLYNIWYDKVQDYSNWKDRRDAKLAGKRFKLNVERDVGETKASKHAYICLHFSRGRCVHGPDCHFRHELPTPDDEKWLDMLHDVFGRERHRSDREDMGGVGSFLRNCTTLYLGGIRTVPRIEEVLKKAFGKFGEITNIRVIHGRSMAFVTYKYRVCAEFAKEAMSDQSIIGNEIINVRWANEDPNNQAQNEKEDTLRKEAWSKMKEKNPEYFSQYESLQQEEYPDTDPQYYQFYLQQQLEQKEQQKRQEIEQQAYIYSYGEKKKKKAQNTQSSASSSSSSSAEIPSEQIDRDTVVEAEDGVQPEEPSTGGKKRKREDDQENNDQEAVEKNEDSEESDEEPEKPEGQPATATSATGMKRTSYDAWQRWYAAQGYPGFNDPFGNYHYYDPAVSDPRSIINTLYPGLLTGKTDGSAAVATTTQEGAGASSAEYDTSSGAATDQQQYYYGQQAYGQADTSGYYYDENDPNAQAQYYGYYYQPQQGADDSQNKPLY